MNRMPEPPARQPHAPQAGQPTLNPHALQFLTEVEDALAAATKPAPPIPTSFRNDALPDTPAIGDTPPVPQPETRRVPSWATGIAIASLGIGAGTTGIGCAAWLVFKGLSLVSLPSLQTFALILLAPFAGLAIATVAIGAAVAKAKRANTTHVYKGSVTVTSKTEVHSTARGMFARNRNELPR